MEVTAPSGDRYETTNSTYGMLWQTAPPFPASFTHSAPYRTLTNRAGVTNSQLPKDRGSLSLVHSPDHPCGIMSMSNVPTNTRGEFTGVRRDLYSSHQGLWSNSSCNTPGATINAGPAGGTYSNLQGAWARVGPSTYESTHGRGGWVSRWGAMTFEPATTRTLYDHPNVNPHNNWVPRESRPQNM